MDEAESRTPTDLGFRMPAEWSPHAATWLVWPHRESDFPGKLEAAEWVYVEIVRHLLPREPVRMIVHSSEQHQRATTLLKRSGLNPTRLEFFEFPNDRSWIRDNGPLFLTRDQDNVSRLAVARFRFNGWAKYPEWRLDDQVPEQIAAALQIDIFRATNNGRDIVLEGGGIDVNGSGSLLATEQCLLGQETRVRNPGLTRSELEHAFEEYLGVTNVIWLPLGLNSDDTHGHVDNLCRFVREDQVVACRTDATNENHQILEDNWKRLSGARNERGVKIDVVELPMPEAPVLDGDLLPASYANFYIANGIVLAPTYNDPQDYKAIGILSELFHPRQVVGIHSVDLLAGGGSLHCLTQQQPATALDLDQHNPPS